MADADLGDDWDSSHRPFRITEVARFFGVTVQAVHIWIQGGRIRRVRRTSRRGAYLIPRGEVVRLLKAKGREVPGVWTLPRLRVLVIDDDLGIRKLAIAASRGSSPLVDLKTSSGLEDGLLIAGQFHPDVILLDSIGRKDGFSGESALAFIRHAGSLRRTKVIVAASNTRVGRRMVEAGAQGFLLKPFGLSDFRETVLGVAPLDLQPQILQLSPSSALSEGGSSLPPTSLLS